MTRVMCFPVRGTHNLSLVKCVSWVGEHISLGLCVSQVGCTHTTRVMYFPVKNARVNFYTSSYMQTFYTQI